MVCCTPQRQLQALLAITLGLTEPGTDPQGLVHSASAQCALLSQMSDLSHIQGHQDLGCKWVPFTAQKPLYKYTYRQDFTAFQIELRYIHKGDLQAALKKNKTQKVLEFKLEMKE